MRRPCPTASGLGVRCCLDAASRRRFAGRLQAATKPKHRRGDRSESGFWFAAARARSGQRPHRRRSSRAPARPRAGFAHRPARLLPRPRPRLVARVARRAPERRSRGRSRRLLWTLTDRAAGRSDRSVCFRFDRGRRTRRGSACVLSSRAGWRTSAAGSCAGRLGALVLVSRGALRWRAF